MTIKQQIMREIDKCAKEVKEYSAAIEEERQAMATTLRDGTSPDTAQSHINAYKRNIYNLGGKTAAYLHVINILEDADAERG